ncbi:hypothetical protein, partial [Lysobacter sp.]|uniref:hypothetical protein n=1 Tax=Lysobacter sp. TaxID=72226 RepID=UPI002D78E19A
MLHKNIQETIMVQQRFLRPGQPGGRILQLTILAGLVSAAYAQEAAPSPQGSIQTVQVTGYRGSLETSAR